MHFSLLRLAPSHPIISGLWEAYNPFKTYSSARRPLLRFAPSHPIVSGLWETYNPFKTHCDSIYWGLLRRILLFQDSERLTTRSKGVTDLPGFRELLGLHRSVHYCLSAFPHEVGRALWVAVHGPGAREAWKVVSTISHFGRAPPCAMLAACAQIRISALPPSTTPWQLWRWFTKWPGTYFYLMDPFFPRVKGHLANSTRSPIHKSLPPIDRHCMVH